MVFDTAALFQPATLGEITLPNRLVMAPLTRTRAIEHLPNQLMAEYYAQRASAGLIISECTMVTAHTSAFGNDPGIYSDEQIAGWQKTTDAVHKAGGKIFMQIWHSGRAAHPLLNNGKPAVGPSAIAIEKGIIHTSTGKQAYTVPLELSHAEIDAIVADFRQGAANAIAAGFDGVEIHAANGYLIDQFLRESANQRQDQYGGSLENRARFLMQVLAAVNAEIGSQRVGVRLSPLNDFNDMHTHEPLELIRYLAEQLNDLDQAYLHVMRGGFFGMDGPDVLAAARAHYKGHLMVNMAYDAAEAAAVLRDKMADSIAFGKAFIANPDLPARILAGAELNTPDPTTFYSADAVGYTDYPFMSA